MLFIALLKAKPGASPKETLGRRAAWKYPEGVKQVAEYWPQTSNPSVIAVFEAQSIGPIMAVTVTWSDAFDITVVPAITAEDGLQLAQQMMPS